MMAHAASQKSQSSIKKVSSSLKAKAKPGFKRTVHQDMPPGEKEDQWIQGGADADDNFDEGYDDDDLQLPHYQNGQLEDGEYFLGYD
jgi:hypothetical protein